MTSIDILRKRIDSALDAIEKRQQPKPVVHLPFVFLTDTGEDWPGYEERNAQAYRQAEFMGIGVSAYAGIDPNDDGSEDQAA